MHVAVQFSVGSEKLGTMVISSSLALKYICSSSGCEGSSASDHTCRQLSAPGCLLPPAARPARRRTSSGVVHCCCPLLYEVMLLCCARAACCLKLPSERAAVQVGGPRPAAGTPRAMSDWRPAGDTGTA